MNFHRKQSNCNGFNLLLMYKHNGPMHVCKMHKTNPIRLTIASYGAVEAHMHSPNVLCVLRAIFIFMCHKLVMIYLETFFFFFVFVRKFWNIHGANLSIHVVYVYIGCVCVCVSALCARFYCRGILIWQIENKSVFVYFHVILFVRDDFIMEQKWLCGFSCCITLQYVRNGESGR